MYQWLFIDSGNDWRMNGGRSLGSVVSLSDIISVYMNFSTAKNENEKLKCCYIMFTFNELCISFGTIILYSRKLLKRCHFVFYYYWTYDIDALIHAAIALYFQVSGLT